MTSATDYLKVLTTEELIQLRDEMKQTSYPEDSFIREVIIDIYGKEKILMIQVMDLM